MEFQLIKTKKTISADQTVNFYLNHLVYFRIQYLAGSTKNNGLDGENHGGFSNSFRTMSKAERLLLLNRLAQA